MARHKASKVIVVIDGQRHIFEEEHMNATLIKTKVDGKPTARLEITIALDAVEVPGQGGKFVRALNTTLT